MGIDGTNGMDLGFGFGADSTSALKAKQAEAEQAIVGEQLDTIDTKIRSKKNEGAYARAGAFLSQNVG